MVAFIDRLPSIATLKAEITSRILGQRSDAAMGPGSDGAILRDVLSHVAYGLHLHMRYGVLNNIFPTKGSGIWLSGWAYLFGLPDGSGGYGRIKARGSAATDGCEFTATGATGDLEGEQFTDSGGNVYQINESYSFVGAGSTTLDVSAVTKAKATNVATSDNETYTWVSTPASMSATITQEEDFITGADAETDSELRGRLQTKLQTPPQGGNWANWVRWIEDTSPGALRAFVWPARAFSDIGYGYGCVDYCAFAVDQVGSARAILDTDDLWDQIETQIEDNAPTLLMRQSRQLEITAISTNIDVTLEMASNTTADNLCDWDAESVDTTVSSVDVGALEITAVADVCSPTVTGGIEIGSRVIVGAGLYGEDIQEGIVSEVNVGADAKVFLVEAWPWTSTLVGKAILSGGGQVLNAIDALVELRDSLGPALGPYAAPIPEWRDVLRLADIKAAVIQACGGWVVDMTINLPATDISPVYDDDDDVDLVLPITVNVWEPK